jgi:hypothetical protein
MTQRAWERIEELYHAALARESSEREASPKPLTRENRELFVSVLTLLRAR